MTQDKLPVIIIGGGGHAKVVADVLQLQGFHVVGFTDINGVCKSLTSTIPNLGDDNVILQQYHSDDVLLANGVGSIQTTTNRRDVHDYWVEQGYRFVSCIHPSAVIATGVEISDGSQIMAGTVIQPGSIIGRNVIVNTKASIDHDCAIGDHAHIAPGVTLSGGVRIGTGAHIGTGATVIQNITIGENSFVGAGAVVVSNVAPYTKNFGIPAKEAVT